MLAFENRLLRTIVSLFILFLILFDPGYEINVESNEHDFTILNTIILILILNDLTLADLHRVISIISSNINLTLSLCLKSYERVVVKALREGDMVCISSVRKISLLVKSTMP